jgi:C4-type Zn-finger protein
MSTIFEKAIKTWSNVANLRFTQIRSEGSDISIEFIPFDINGGSLAKAYSNNQKGVIEIEMKIRTLERKKPMRQKLFELI